MTKEEILLVEKIFREYVETLQSEQYRAEAESGKLFPYYDKEIERARKLKEKILRG